MANLLNIDAEVGANIIGDDTQPTLTITNTSTGAALSVDKLTVTSSASINGVNLVGVLSTASIAVLGIGGPVLAASATVTNLNIAGASRASGAVLALKGDAYVSAVSLIFAAGAGWAGMGAIRIVRRDGTFGWIPVLPDAQVTAAVVS